MANTYLAKTLGTPTNNKKWTLSVWCKRSTLTAVQTIFSAGASATDTMSFSSSGSFNFYVNAGNSGRFASNRLFRDTSAWYHVVLAADSTQSTAANRMKLYINGVQETSFSNATYPSVNYGWKINSAVKHSFGGYSESSSGDFWNGSMSHIHFCDGTQLAPTVFGSTDSTTGQWKINTAPSFTLGNNGFTILKDGKTITDQSSNSNNFALGGGTLTKTEDCPSNVFPTWNPAFMPFNIGNGRADNGGTTIGSPGGDSSSLASMGARSGKYYWEIKVQNAANTRSCGIVRSDLQGLNATNPIYPGGNGNASNFSSSYNMVGGYVQTVTSGTQAQQGSLATLTTGDFLGVALDIDNLNIKWYKNGSLVTTTNLTSAWIANGLFLIPCNRLDGNQFVQYNFGNGCFASTQLTGTTYAGTGGVGIFKYQPPTGFTALSTKGLNL